MRLLHVETRTFQEFYGPPPPYAIASHRWTDEEVSYQDFKNVTTNANLTTAGWRKIRGFCRAVQNLQPLGSKIEWVWIDACCINKADFTEFSEAINSMFRWYAEAEICITYLPDVKSLDGNPIDIMYQFRSSVWFLRGWTLQELLAPALVVFLNQDWEPLGHKQGGRGGRSKKFNARSVGFSLNSRLVEITGIPNSVLYDFEKSKNLSVAEKQAWMKNRTTTRPEDRAYCQLGILGVFMPLIYGEREQAMIRLQDELERKELREKAAQPRSGPPTPTPLPTPPNDNILQPPLVDKAAQTRSHPPTPTPLPTTPNNNLRPPLGHTWTPLTRRRSTGDREPRQKADSPSPRNKTPSPEPSTKTLKIENWLNGGKHFSVTVNMDMTIGDLKNLLAGAQYLGKPPKTFRFAYFNRYRNKIEKDRFEAGYADTQLIELEDLHTVSVVLGP